MPMYKNENFIDHPRKNRIKCTKPMPVCLPSRLAFFADILVSKFLFLMEGQEILTFSPNVFSNTILYS